MHRRTISMVPAASLKRSLMKISVLRDTQGSEGRNIHRNRRVRQASDQHERETSLDFPQTPSVELSTHQKILISPLCLYDYPTHHSVRILYQTLLSFGMRCGCRWWRRLEVVGSLRNSTKQPGPWSTYGKIRDRHFSWNSFYIQRHRLQIICTCMIRV